MVRQKYAGDTTEFKTADGMEVIERAGDSFVVPAGSSLSLDDIPGDLDVLRVTSPG